MKRVKGLVLIMVMLLVGGIFVGCEEVSNSTTQEKAYQEKLVSQANKKLGMPEITNFFEKSMAKEIFELRDDSKLICYLYTVSEMSGKYVYIGKCMGYGLSYSTQYTNPDKIERYAEVGETQVIAQADPNGLYSGDGLSATWVYMINEDTGKPQITYMEPEVIVSQAKLPKRLIETWSLPAKY
mgnify:CR=1 FL=1